VLKTSLFRCSLSLTVISTAWHFSIPGTDINGANEINRGREEHGRIAQRCERLLNERVTRGDTNGTFFSRQ